MKDNLTVKGTSLLIIDVTQPLGRKKNKLVDSILVVVNNKIRISILLIRWTKGRNLFKIFAVPIITLTCIRKNIL